MPKQLRRKCLLLYRQQEINQPLIGENQHPMKKIIFITLALWPFTLLIAQGKVEDYKRAYSIRELYSGSKVYYSDVNPTWIGDSDNFWYIRNTPEGREYVLVDAGDKNSKPLFDHQTLAGKLGQATGEQVEALKLQLERLRVNDELSQLSFGFKGKNWVYYLAQDSLQGETVSMERPGRTGSRTHWMVTDEERDRGAVNSPDNKYQAYIKDHNVYVRELPRGKEIALSIDGCVGNYYSSYIQWSPDSRMLATTKIRPVEKRYIHMVESSPSDQLQPKLRTLEYTKPGDELRFRVPCIFKVETQEALIPSTELFNNQYQLSGLRWNKDNSGITFEYNERAHKVYRVLEMSAQNGLVRSLIEETAETFVNYSRRFRHDLRNDEEIIWMSERDNWNHLYLYDRKSGSVKNQITKGEWYVRDIIRVDEDARRIYFTANGVPKKGDPYLVRYYYINMDGSGLTCLTPDEGHHRATFSRDMKYLVDVYSRVDLAPVAQLRDAESGKLIMPLEKADISELEKTGWKAPEVFVAKGRDGKTDIWGIIIRPSNFDPNKKYPIIEYIYSGPGSHYVPKSFAPYYSDMTNLAELGFIVVKMDGMGTSFRSKAFEEICYQNLKDAGFPDRILWIKAAAKKYPYMDVDKVGIFGASAGGQEAMAAVLFHPEMYKAAYSSCGCHDNRMDKIWWNEQWMSYPIGKQYLESSNVVNAHLLTRPLMLVVGELDDNVDPASTMQVVDALIKANKDFELVVLPGVGHTMGGSYGEHKRFDFFVRELLNVVPPKWNEIKTD